jgi:hypothetical protein
MEIKSGNGNKIGNENSNKYKSAIKTILKFVSDSAQ